MVSTFIIKATFVNCLHLQTVWPQIRPNRKSVVISIQTFDTLGPWFKILIFVSGQAAQTLNRCSDCVCVCVFF